MRFLIAVIDDSTGTATRDEMAAIDEFNERLRDDGHWVLAGGLAAPSEATVIDNRGGSGLMADGAYIEADEFMSGFWVIDAADLDTALEIASDGSLACNRKVELRPFQ